MDYCKHSTFQSERFKEKSLILFDLVKQQLDSLQKPLFSPFILTMIRTVINSKNSHEIIHNFISETHINWKDIKDKNEEQLIDTLLKAFISKDKMPDFVKTSIENFVDFLHNRKEFVSDEFEEDVWEIIDDMVKHSIIYIHYRRVPNPTYTKQYFPEISVKNNSELWAIKF